MSNVLTAANPYSAISTNAPSAVFPDGSSTPSPESQMTPLYEVLRRSPAAATAAASTSANLTASVLSQVAAAASSQALAEASTSSDDGSKIGVLAQIIIAIGVIPVQLVIITIVLGIHRLVHRKHPRPLQISAVSAPSTQESPPYLQPKAELEDDRRHELHGEHPVRELDDEGEILEIADKMDSTVQSLQARQGISEMPQANGPSWDNLHQGRSEVMGDEIAQELECPISGREDSVEVRNLQGLEYPIRAGCESMVSESAKELECPVQAKEQPIRMGEAQDRATPGYHSFTHTTHSSHRESHFMLRQQQMTEINALAATD